MNASPKSTPKILKILVPGGEEREARFVLPFFLLVMLALIFLYAITLFTLPATRQLPVLIPFTILMIIHAMLHWTSILFMRKQNGTLLYLGVQGALAFSMTVIAGSSALSYGLYMALIGESIGMLRKPFYKAAAVIALVSLSAISVLLVAREQNLVTWMFIILPMTLFVVIYTTLYGRESEARQKAQSLAEELEAANRQLGEYAGEIETLTLANERERMARELHDTLAQGLAGLILQLEAADAHLSSGRAERAQAIVQQAMGRARTALAEARRAIDDLRSGERTPDALERSLRSEVEHFSQATGIPCELTLSLPEALPVELEDPVCRLVAEGLTNVARHAQASRAWVRIQPLDAGLEIVIGDNGRGFDPEQETARPGHYGLLGMRERARLAGGSLAVETAPGKGTILMLTLPVKGEAK